MYTVHTYIHTYICVYVLTYVCTNEMHVAEKTRVENEFTLERISEYYGFDCEMFLCATTDMCQLASCPPSFHVYHIPGKFRGVKLLRIPRFHDFRKKTFTNRCILYIDI